jgi:hypothetical protein
MTDGLVIDFRLSAPCDPMEKKGAKGPSRQLLFDNPQDFLLLWIEISRRRRRRENVS